MIRLCPNELLLITPLLIVTVIPSTLTPPSVEVVAVGIACNDTFENVKMSTKSSSLHPVVNVIEVPFVAVYDPVSNNVPLIYTFIKLMVYITLNTV